MNPVERMICLGLALALGPAAAAQAPAAPQASASPPSIAPSLVSHVLPSYPQIAVSAGVQGLVEHVATIGADGRVEAIRINRSNPLLDQAVFDAVRQWRFAAPPGKSAQVTVIVRFGLNDPFYYPRPVVFHQPLPSWIPHNFAFVYKYECRRTTVEIDSISRLVVNMRNGPTATRAFAFGFEVGQASDALVTLVGVGFFDASFGDRPSPVEEGERSTWDEFAPVEPGIQHAGDRIIVTVAASELRGVDVHNFRQVHWIGGDQPPRRYRHALKVRRGNRWTEFRWREPIDARHSEHEKALAMAGKRIRALVKRNLTDRQMQPDCL